MIPTIDISNILKKAVYVAGWAFLNPVAWSAVLAVAAGTLIAAIARSTGSFEIPSIDATLPSGNQWLEWMCYCIALDECFSVLNSFISFVNVAVPFLVGAIPAFLAALWAFRARSVVRKAYEALVR